MDSGREEVPYDDYDDRRGDPYAEEDDDRRRGYPAAPSPEYGYTRPVNHALPKTTIQILIRN